MPRTAPSSTDNQQLALPELLFDPGWDWQEFAACLNQGNETWYNQKKQSVLAEALNVCASCPVQMTCREFAIKNLITNGTWGGLSQADLIVAVKEYKKEQNGE